LQLLEVAYTLAAAPAVYRSDKALHGNNLMPNVRDQGGCASCVAEATMGAIEAAIAASLKRNASENRLSSATFYFCSPGGKTCNSGWDLGRAMELVRRG
jgi:C1A family cysteine protease